jgi:hypothetical protein
MVLSPRSTQNLPQEVLDEAYKRLKLQNELGNPNTKTTSEQLGISKECENLRGVELVNKPECLIPPKP